MKRSLKALIAVTSKLAGPGAPGLVFLLLLAIGLTVGRTQLFQDPGTFWHLRLGQEILRTGCVPRADTLTSTRFGAAWVDQSWAFDAGLALLVQTLGWSGAVLVASLILAWTYGSLAGWLEREGHSLYVVLGVPLVAAAIGAIHFHVRPHLFTLAFLSITLRLCRNFHEHGGRRIAWIPVLMIPWANLHGGFLAGPAVLAGCGLSLAIGAWNDSVARRRLIVVIAVFVLSLAAPLINPYGLGLYRHVFGLLHSAKVTDLIQEYQPLAFGKPEALVFEGVLLALIVLPMVRNLRPKRVDLVQTLLWLHAALISIRNAPLFGLAVAPALADLVEKKPAEGSVLLPERSAWRGWALASSLLALALVASGTITAGPDPRKWPLAGLQILDSQPTAARLFHEQDWGGLIELASKPRRQAYLDDRFELWGRAGILEYAGAIEGGPDWDTVRDREQIALVWIRPDRDLARRLRLDPGWQILHEDPLSILLKRDPAQTIPGDLASRDGG